MIIKQILVVPLLLIVLSLTAPNQAVATLMFTASLDQSQVTIPTGSLATGQATLTLNNAQTRLEIDIQLFGLDLNTEVTRLHIHRGAFGVNGPIVFGFIDPNNDLNGDLDIDFAAGTLFSAWDLTEGNNTTLAAELPNLLSEGLYLNVHTNAFPGGEIRGQIVRVPEPATLALLGMGLVIFSFRRSITVFKIRR